MSGVEDINMISIFVNGGRTGQNYTLEYFIKWRLSTEYLNDVTVTE
jgi:hypothetical protein